MFKKLCNKITKFLDGDMDATIQKCVEAQVSFENKRKRAEEILELSRGTENLLNECKELSRQIQSKLTDDELIEALNAWAPRYP